MNKVIPHTPPPGRLKFNSRDPDHPRYCSPGRVKAIRFSTRMMAKRALIKNGTAGLIEGRQKNSGPCFYKSVSRKGASGPFLVRVNHEGRPLPRMRDASKGMTGKRFMRRWRKEQRDERRQANAA